MGRVALLWFSIYQTVQSASLLNSLWVGLSWAQVWRPEASSRKCPRCQAEAVVRWNNSIALNLKLRLLWERTVDSFVICGQTLTFLTPMHYRHTSVETSPFPRCAAFLSHKGFTSLHQPSSPVTSFPVTTIHMPLLDTGSTLLINPCLFSPWGLTTTLVTPRLGP